MRFVRVELLAGLPRFQEGLVSRFPIALLQEVFSLTKQRVGGESSRRNRGDVVSRIARERSDSRQNGRCRFRWYGGSGNGLTTGRGDWQFVGLLSFLNCGQNEFGSVVECSKSQVHVEDLVGLQGGFKESARIDVCSSCFEQLIRFGLFTGSHNGCGRCNRWYDW